MRRASRRLRRSVRSPIHSAIEHAGADAEEQADEALGDRSDATEAETAGVGRVLDVLGHVGDDVVRPRAGVSAPGSNRGMLPGPGLDRLGDLGRGETVQRRRRRARSRARRRRR